MSNASHGCRKPMVDIVAVWNIYLDGAWGAFPLYTGASDEAQFAALYCKLRENSWILGETVPSFSGEQNAETEDEPHKSLSLEILS